MIALGIQRLHASRRLTRDLPFLRIIDREGAAGAPLQFDSARSLLHRRGCRSIPSSSRTALYGVWSASAEEMELACPRCKPVPRRDDRSAESEALDMLYGFLSIIDQFGGVLKERGREYRRSREGQRLKEDLNGVYEEFGDRERNMLDVVLSSLEGMLKTVQDLDRKLSEQNGAEPGPADGRPSARRGNGKKP